MKLKTFYIILTLLIINNNLIFPQLPLLKEGTKIKVTIKTGQNTFPIIGTVKKISSDSLTLAIQSKLFGIPSSDIQKIEIGIEGKKHTVEGILIGGVPMSLFLGAQFYSDSKNAKGWQKIGQPSATTGFITGFLLGGIIGGLIGEYVTTNYWIEVYPKSRVPLGENLVDDISEKLSQEKSPFYSLVLSSFFPGIGQYYNGDIGKGFIQDLLFVGGLLITSEDRNQNYYLLGRTILFGTWLWSIVDALVSAIENNNKIWKRKDRTVISKKVQTQNVMFGFTPLPKGIGINLRYYF